MKQNNGGRPQWIRQSATLSNGAGPEELRNLKNVIIKMHWAFLLALAIILIFSCGSFFWTFKNQPLLMENKMEKFEELRKENVGLILALTELNQTFEGMKAELAEKSTNLETMEKENSALKKTLLEKDKKLEMTKFVRIMGIAAPILAFICALMIFPDDNTQPQYAIPAVFLIAFISVSFFCSILISLAWVGEWMFDMAA